MQTVTLQEVASKLWELGFTPIPIKTGEKSPALKELEPFLNQHPTQDDVMLAFEGHDGNIGLVVGVEHGNICVLDVDDEETFRGNTGDLLDKILSYPTPIVKTPRGYHIYFEIPNSLKEATIIRKNSTLGVELRVNKGYVLIPPSQVGGKPYQWIKSIFDFKPIPIPLELLEVLELANGNGKHQPANLEDLELPQPNIQLGNLIIPPQMRKAIKDTILPYYKEGQREMTLFYLASGLIRWGFNYSQVEELILEIANEGGDREIRQRRSIVPSILKKVLRGEPIASIYSLTEYLPQEEVERVATIIKQELNRQKETSPENTKLMRLSDAFFVTLMTSYYGGELVYVVGWDKWLRWNGKVWEDVTSRMPHLLWEIVEDFVTYVNNTETDTKLKEKKIAWAWGVLTKKRIESVLFLAKSHPVFLTTPSTFDADPCLINVQNGVVDLRTGELLPHSPDFKMTRIANVEYNPEWLEKPLGETAPLWDNFINFVTCNDQELKLFLQRVLGYTLFGQNFLQKVFFLRGTGMNGKSTLMNAMLEILGDYARYLPRDVFIQNRRDNHPAVNLTLEGVRLGVNSELGNSVIDDDMLKLATGEDPVTARQLYSKHYYSFKVKAKVFIMTNHKPKIADKSKAMLRRVVIIPFRNEVPINQVDVHLLGKLLAEKNGFFAWLVKGAMEVWQSNTLNEPKVVKEAIASFFEGDDVIGLWLRERCDLSDITAETPFKELYQDFVAWCEVNGFPKVSEIKFSRYLSDFKGLDTFIVKMGGKAIKIKRGIKLRENTTPTPPEETTGEEQSTQEEGFQFDPDIFPPMEVSFDFDDDDDPFNIFRKKPKKNSENEGDLWDSSIV